MRATDTSHWGRPDHPAPAVAGYANAVTGERLVFGAGRSYGDVCRNDAGTLLTGHPATHWDIDAATGTLTVDAGMTLGAVLQRLEGTGWFLPVLPGTRFVTVGGAVANDIHGKNHHRRGTFGYHVEMFDLHRSSGETLACSPDENAALFAATIGGMGMTGRIGRVTIRLMPVASARIRQTVLPFANLSELLHLEDRFAADSEYAVAWIDSLATGTALGRGHLIIGDHIADPAAADWSPAKLSVPVTPPLPLVSGLPLRAFNALYRFANGKRKTQVVDPGAFFFPLDAVGQWNPPVRPRAACTSTRASCPTSRRWNACCARPMQPDRARS